MKNEPNRRNGAEEWDGYVLPEKPGFSSEEDYLERKAQFDADRRQIAEELKKLNKS